MAMNRAQFAKMLEPGLNTLFGLEYDSYPPEFAKVLMQIHQIKLLKKMCC